MLDEKRVSGYIRLQPHRGLPKVLVETLSPLTYKENVLKRIEAMGNTEVVEFLDIGKNVLLTVTVKMAKETLTHVNNVLEKVDFDKLDTTELNILRYANPADFWKSKQVQSIIEKIMG